METGSDAFDMDAHQAVVNAELADLPEATRLALLRAVVDSIRWAQAYAERQARSYAPEAFDARPATEAAQRQAALQTGRDGGYNHAAVCVSHDLATILGLPQQPPPVLPSPTSVIHRVLATDAGKGQR